MSAPSVQFSGERLEAVATENTYSAQWTKIMTVGSLLLIVFLSYIIY